MTTLAIIGGGIAGRSLIYALAKKGFSASEILLFDSDNFARTCSLRSTAIVAPRGVTTGHSDLGDTIAEAFRTFSSHVELDKPQGVYSITQYTSALTKLDQFKKRYPCGSDSNQFFKNAIYTAKENAFMIDPKQYMDWLLSFSSSLPFKLEKDIVIKVEEEGTRFKLTTQNQKVFIADKVIYCGGSYNRYWQPTKSGKPVQGSYLEFDFDLGTESLSITLEGDNFIYHAHSKKLLIGSTTDDLLHEIAPATDLKAIHGRLTERLSFTLPDFNKGVVRVGLREKAQKRAPYLYQEGQKFYLGGFYKNGYSLALHLSEKLIQTLQ